MTNKGVYALYDDFYQDKPSSIVLGGRNRAKTALRDKQGRFMPNAEWMRDLWELDPNHGRAGARARWAKTKQTLS